MPAVQTVHATCVLVGESAVLIRGPSGAGKSRLAILLCERAQAAGLFAALVGDDRVILSPAGGRLVARGHPVLAGKMEMRGIGIVDRPGERAGVVRLVVDLADPAPDRLPLPDRQIAVWGIAVAHLVLWQQIDPTVACLGIMACLHQSDGNRPRP